MLSPKLVDGFKKLLLFRGLQFPDTFRHSLEFGNPNLLLPYASSSVERADEDWPSRDGLQHVFPDFATPTQEAAINRPDATRISRHIRPNVVTVRPCSERLQRVCKCISGEYL